MKNPDPRCVVYRTVDTYYYSSSTVQLHSTVLVVSSTTVPYVLCIRICTVLRIGMTMYVCDQDPASLAGHSKIHWNKSGAACHWNFSSGAL